jgi:hypothetical protein
MQAQGDPEQPQPDEAVPHKNSEDNNSQYD